MHTACIALFLLVSRVHSRYVTVYIYTFVIVKSVCPVTDVLKTQHIQRECGMSVCLIVGCMQPCFLNIYLMIKALPVLCIQCATLAQTLLQLARLKNQLAF